ncbi:hypothetical protein [Pseudonocardia sp. DLS-67]
MTARRSLALLCGAVAGSLAVVGCSEPVVPPPPTPIPPSRSLPSPYDSALAAYLEYWEVSDAARAAPDDRSWRRDLEAVARGQALETALTDVENYASIPAHTVGTIRRSPVVENGTPERVTVLDCVDIGESRLIRADGTVLDDLENQPQRFRLRALIVRVDDRWLVEQTSPDADEPC